MKLLTVLLLAMPVFAYAFEGGTLSGTCTLRAPEGVHQFSFLVPANSQANLGYLGTDSGPSYGHYVINIVNNTGAEEKEKTWGYAIAIGFSREGDNVVRNPNRLCPTSPRDLDCEEENRKNSEPFPYSPRDAFKILPENNGSVVLEPLRADFDQWGDIPFYTIGFTSVQMQNGLTFSTPIAPLGGIKATCTARFDL